MYKNPKDIFIDFAKYPAALETVLPEVFPRLSPTLISTANSFPVLPDFPVEIPVAPDVPALPEIPLPGGASSGLRVTKAEVTPIRNGSVRDMGVTPLEQAYTQPMSGVSQEVITRRGV